MIGHISDGNTSTGASGADQDAEVIEDGSVGVPNLPIILRSGYVLSKRGRRAVACHDV